MDYFEVVMKKKGLVKVRNLKSYFFFRRIIVGLAEQNYSGIIGYTKQYVHTCYPIERFSGVFNINLFLNTVL